MSLRALVIASLMLIAEAGVGTQNHGISVELHSTIEPLYVGDEIAIVFVVTNVGTSTYRYTHRGYDRSGRMQEYRLEAYDEGGANIVDPRTRSRVPQGYVGGGLSTVAELEPGERFSKTIPVNLSALITEPGCTQFAARM